MTSLSWCILCINIAILPFCKAAHSLFKSVWANTTHISLNFLFSSSLTLIFQRNSLGENWKIFATFQILFSLLCLV